MALQLPEGWSWEQVSDNGTDKTEGIRFYKTDDPTVSYTLLCWTGGYGICGTGVTSEEITLANGMKVWQHTEENTEKGHHGHGGHLFEDVPGSYVASPSETMTTEVWNANRDALLSILGTAQIGRKSVSQQAAIDAAKAQYTGAYDQVYATYDVTSGAWTVSFSKERRRRKDRPSGGGRRRKGHGRREVTENRRKPPQLRRFLLCVLDNHPETCYSFSRYRR